MLIKANLVLEIFYKSILFLLAFAGGILCILGPLKYGGEVDLLDGSKYEIVKGTLKSRNASLSLPSVSRGYKVFGTTVRTKKDIISTYEYVVNGKTYTVSNKNLNKFDEALVVYSTSNPAHSDTLTNLLWADRWNNFWCNNNSFIYSLFIS